MKQKTGRKLLSFLLTLAMVVGLVPGMGLTAEAATIQYDDYLVEVTNHNQNFIAAGICDQTTGLKCKTLSVETARALENYLKSKTGSKVAVIYGCTIRSNPGWSRISFVIDGTTDDRYYMDASIANAISNRNARNEAEYKLFYVKTDAPDFETANETVTFKVINGQWDDGTTEDVTVSLSGLKDEIRLAADQIPAVGTKPNDTYKAGSWDVTPSSDTAITAATTYTYTYAQKDSVSQTVTFKVANGKWDDDSTEDKTVTLTGYEGDTLKLASNQIPAVGNEPNDTYKAGSWNVTPSTDTAITEATTYTYTYVQKSSITPTVSIEGWTYGEAAKAPSVNGNTGNGTVTYTYAKKGTTDFSSTVPSAAGEYTVKAVIAETDDYLSAEATADFTIAKANATVSVPTPKTLTYNGYAQELVNEGSATGGTMKYAVTTENKAPTDENLYTTSIPTGKEAGTYYVWYKVVGDKNHNDTEPKCVTVTMKEEVKTSIDTEVNTSDDAPAVKVDNLDEDFAEKLLRDEEKEEYENGTPVLVYLDVEVLNKADVPAADIAAVEKVLSADGYTYGECLDLSLWKKLGDGAPIQIQDTHGNPIKIKISIPDTMKKIPTGYTRKFQCIRVHDGVATVMAEGTGSELEISSDKFSSYFLVYKDTKTETATTTTEVTTAAASTSDATTATATEAAKISPKTGDSMPIAVLVVLILSAAGMLVFMDLKKKKN